MIISLKQGSTGAGTSTVRVRVQVRVRVRRFGKTQKKYDTGPHPCNSQWISVFQRMGETKEDNVYKRKRKRTRKSLNSLLPKPDFSALKYERLKFGPRQ
ncbi:unnamed protein product [Camellia sinensis]